MYLFILLASVAGCYDPLRVLWGGLCAAISWAGAFYYLATRPNAFTIFDTGFPVNGETVVTLTADPCFVDIEKLFEMIVVVGVVTVILATVAQRARRIVRAEISATRERANLARYSAPSMAENLANQDTPFDVITSQKAAVLFADVVGFTKAAEN
jgi:adenylate cyclase